MAVTRTVTVSNPGTVAVKPGQHLFFTLEAEGPIPIFTFASRSTANGEKVIVEADPDNPKKHHEWKHSDIEHRELLGLGLNFLTNAKYTYKVERRDDAGLKEVILDVGYTGEPTDTIDEAFRVLIVA